MKLIRSRVVLLLLAIALGFSAGQASAEGFIQLSVGSAFTDDADFKFDFGGASITVEDVEFEDSVSVDLGGGAFFSVIPFLDLGLQAGIGYYQPTVDTAAGFDDLEFNMIPFSVIGMVRIPLFKSDRLPHGLIQPYVGIGPAFVISYLEIDDIGGDASAVGFDVGFDLRAGLNIQLTKLLGIFVQYKRIEVDSTLTDSSDDLDIDFRTDSISAGLGFHF
jgi:hypothetical protein